jgi:CubicO group peptidase (beta-lactamase class C family)
MNALASLLLVAVQNPTHPDLAELTPRWEQAMQVCGVPALAVVVVEGDEVVHRVTLGRRDPARDAPVTKDTLFYIASATKPYVAFALAQLAEQGRLDLDAPVARYLPRFRLADAELARTITVRDLLCHRPGLNSREIVLLDAFTGEITEERYYHFLERVRPLGRVSYSNLHFTLAGRVIEAVSGLTWRDYLAQHLFAPAGMTRTTGYADKMYAEDDVAIPARAVGTRIEATPVRKTDRTMHAAGGLGTSIDDLARWLRLQLGRGSLDGVRLLSELATEASWELQAPSKDDAEFGPVEGFALGWQRGRYRDQLELRHGGDYAGSASAVFVLPEAGLGLGILAIGGGGARAVRQLVATDVRERFLSDGAIQDPLPELLERARAERAADEQRASEAGARTRAELELTLPRERYAGVFHNEWLGTLKLEWKEHQLAARLGDLALELEGRGPNAFELDSEGPSNAPGAFELAGPEVRAVVLQLGEAVRFERYQRSSPP